MERLTSVRLPSGERLISLRLTLQGKRGSAQPPLKGRVTLRKPTLRKRRGSATLLSRRKQALPRPSSRRRRSFAGLSSKALWSSRLPLKRTPAKHIPSINGLTSRQPSSRRGRFSSDNVPSIPTNKKLPFEMLL